MKEQIIVGANSKGTVHPAYVALCQKLAQRGYRVILLNPSNESASIPNFPKSQRCAVVRISDSDGLGRKDAHHRLEALLAHHSKTRPRLIYAVIDLEMGGLKEVFWKFNIRVFGFVPFGACAAALEWARWEARVGDIKPQQMRLTCLDFEPESWGRPRGSPTVSGLDLPPDGGAKPGDQPLWALESKGLAGLIFNTSNELERDFLMYLEKRTELKVYGVGPLLGEQYLKAPVTRMNWIRCVVSGVRRFVDGTEVGRESVNTEKKVSQWLSEPRGSVLYVDWDGKGENTTEEYRQLAGALRESDRPFIWAIKNGWGIADSTEEGCFLQDLETKVGDRGLIICGGAPQRLILSHPSTGGFLSNCNWNSTVEALVHGVPILAWPVKDDQFYNSKLVVSHLKVGYRVAKMVQEDIMTGIEMLMGDNEMGARAARLRYKGIPECSEAELDGFLDDAGLM